MAAAVIVIGAVEGVRREIEKHLGERAELLIVRLAQKGGFRLEPHPQSAVQMVEAVADRAENYGRVLVIELPYAACPEKLDGTVRALQELGATVLRPAPASAPWPARPKALDERFRQALRNAILAAVDEWLPGGLSEESLTDSIARARGDFSDTLEIAVDLVVDTRLKGDSWYRAFRALDELCLMERQGEAQNKREILQRLLAKHVGLSKGTYKVGDTGVYVTVAGKKIELRERVHLREGRPAETESIYWITIGDTRVSYRYFIGRIGKHA
jgi:hypothetical protein